MAAVVGTMEEALETVRKNGRDLLRVPERLKTPEVCMEAVARWGRALAHVPKKLKTPEICMAAVRQDGWALKFVPEAVRMSEEICLAAVGGDGWALKFVPMWLRSEEICLAAVKDAGRMLESVPESMRDDIRHRLDAWLEKPAAEAAGSSAAAAEALDAVKRDGMALQYVPDRLRTEEVCLAAVQRNGAALRYVPEELKTRELCMQAVKAPQFATPGAAMAHVPEKLKTPEFCLEAVLHDDYNLRFVPEGMRGGVARRLEDGMETPPASVPPGSPLDAACAAFAEAAGRNLPDGCSLRLDAEHLEDGRMRVCVMASDRHDIVWRKKETPVASAVYSPKDGSPLALSAVLGAFADTLEGRTEKSLESLPNGLRLACARGAGAAAKAAAAAAEAPEEEDFSAMRPC